MKLARILTISLPLVVPMCAAFHDYDGPSVSLSLHHKETGAAVTLWRKSDKPVDVVPLPENPPDSAPKNPLMP